MHGILFLTLNIFSATGGIEKVSRIAGKALQEISDDVDIYSMYDRQDECDEKYFSEKCFNGFGGKKIAFVNEAVRAGKNKSVVILSHINLLSIGFLIKLISPNTKLLMLAHGIEVWRQFPGWKKKVLSKCDLFLPVSQYTMDTMIRLNGFDNTKFTVLNNCLDPFLQQPITGGKNRQLMEKYGFDEHDKILMTLSRMSSTERYKGYDKVLEAMDQLDQENLKYMIIGKYDAVEKQRLDKLIASLGLKDKVVFTGFIADDAMADHFSIADVYVMPSEKEGFGIVFIEAMYYGKPVIAGNRDGSVDALAGGQLGKLVDPQNTAELITAICDLTKDHSSYIPDRNILENKFSYHTYKQNLKQVLSTVI